MRAGFLLVVFLVPTAMASEWTDGEDDHEVGIAIETPDEWVYAWAPASADEWAAWADIRSVSLVEEDESLRFAVEAVGPRPDGGVVSYTLSFDHRGERHALFIRQSDGTVAGWGKLAEDGVYAGVRDVRYEVPGKSEGGRHEAVFEKRFLLDDGHLPPTPGTVWTDLRLHMSGNAGIPRSTWCLVGVECSPVYRDLVAMDDVVFAAAAGEYDLLALQSDAPVRVSNGAATVLRWDVRALALSEAVEFTPNFDNVPDGWTILAPRGMTLEPGLAVEFPVVASVPFIHSHGTYEEFRLIPDVAGLSLPLAVLWPEDAAPARHHPRLHLQGQGFDGQLKTTAPEQPVDAHAARFTRTIVLNGPAIEENTLTWRFWMRDLGVGLETLPGPLPLTADVELAGALDGDARMRLLLIGDEELELATASLPPTLYGAGSHTLDVDLAWTADAGRHPFVPGTDLLLEIIMDGEVPPEALPASLTERTSGNPYGRITGGSLRLPLAEYHDAFGEETAGIDVQLLEQITDANPGRGVLVEGSFAPGHGVTTLHAMAPVPGVTVAPAIVEGVTGMTPLAVHVQVPDTAEPGDRIPVVLFARDDVGGYALHSFEIVVRHDIDVPDESRQAEDAKDAADDAVRKESPAASSFVAIVVAAAALLRRR